MQKYGQDFEFEPSRIIKRDNGPYYLVTEVDAEIAALQATLRTEATVLQKAEQRIKELELLLGRHGDVKQSTDF